MLIAVVTAMVPTASAAAGTVSHASTPPVSLSRLPNSTTPSFAPKETRFPTCAIMVRDGHIDAARLCYQQHAALTTDAEARGEARLQAALCMLKAGGPELARRELSELIYDLPSTEAARRAFVAARWLHRQKGGASQECAFLADVASRLSWVAEPGAIGGDHGDSMRALHLDALLAVGRLKLLQLHDPLGAYRTLTRVDTLLRRGDAHTSEVQLLLGRSLRMLGRHEEALAYYQRLLSKAPATAAGIVTITRAEDAPVTASALFEVGETLAEQSRFSEAQAAYNELLRRMPNTPQARDAA